MKRIAQLLSVSTVVLVTSSAAQTLPDGMFSIGKFEIGKATISDVQEYFGSAEVRSMEPGDGADRGVCYSNGTTASAPTVVFETGALGGWKQITAYRLTKRHKRQCSQTSIALAELSTANGLHLLSSKQVALQALNRATSLSSTKLHVEDVYKRKATPEEMMRMHRANEAATQLSFDVIDTVDVRFKGNALDDLYVKRLVSY